MTEQALWHWAAIIVFGLTLYRLRKGLLDSTSWFCVFFCIGYSGNILGYPFVFLGLPGYHGLENLAATTLHGRLFLVGMLTAWAVHYIFYRQIATVGAFKSLPGLAIPEWKIEVGVRVGTLCGALLSMSLSLLGYYGYFMSVGYLHKPPAWLDGTKALVDLASGLLFLVIVKDFQSRTKLSQQTTVLIVLWVFTGFLTGFKTYVVAPGLFVVIGAWFSNRCSARHLALLALLIIAAYSVVQPMREAKQLDPSISALEAFVSIVSHDDFSIMEMGNILDRFLRRLDYTKDAVTTLTAYDRGSLSEYKRRLDEYFRLTPAMAVVPRMFWPTKPPEDLGAVLYYELTGNKGSSITPSQTVVSYVWGGWLGVVLNAAAWALLCTVAGQIVVNTKTSVYKHAPFMLLAIVFSQGASIMASYYCFVIRIVLGVIVLHQLGVLRNGERRAQTSMTRS